LALEPFTARDIGSESRCSPILSAFGAPVRGGGPRRNIAITFGTGKN